MKINILLLLPFIFYCLNSNAQIQIGNTVYNNPNDVNFSRSISMNDQGNIVAVAADGSDTANGNESGLVRVFELNNTTNLWEQKGDDILGDNDGDKFGSSISLNSIGDLLAIGAPLNDSDGFQSGVVQVFEFNNSNNKWEQKGNNIYDGLSDYFTGSSVILNGLGTRVAVGTPVSTGNGFHLGNIVVFDFDPIVNDWIQVGDHIFGTQNYVNLGYSVALNNSGNVLIAGGPGLYRNTNSPVKGMVKIYELVNATWTQKGGDIVGTQAGDLFGGSVDINNDGNVIAIAALLNDENGNNSGKINIFEYDGSEWLEKGTPILGEAEDKLNNVKIDNVGNKVLVSSHGYNHGLGKVELFEFNNENWNQIGSSILGDSTNDVFGTSTSMTSDGNYIVSGSSRNDDVNSYFKVYNTSNQALSIINKELYNLLLYFDENDLILKYKNIVINDVNVFNALGQEIKINDIDSPFFKIRFSDSLDTGVYYIRLSTDKGVLSKKVLFKKTNS